MDNTNEDINEAPDSAKRKMEEILLVGVILTINKNYDSKVSSESGAFYSSKNAVRFQMLKNLL